MECRQKICAALSNYLPPKLLSRLETVLAVTNATDVTVAAEDTSKTVFQKALSFLPLINKANIMYLLLVLLCWEGKHACCVFLSSPERNGIIDYSRSKIYFILLMLVTELKT